MGYKVFCLKKSKISMALSIITMLVIFISITLLVVQQDNLFKIGLGSALILSIIKTIIEKGNIIFNKAESNKSFLNKPIVLSEDSVYIVSDKSGFIIFVIIILLIVFLVNIFNLNGEILYDFIICGVLIAFEFGFLIKDISEKYLKNNANNLYNILNNKNIRYDVFKVDKLTKCDDESYIFVIGNNKKQMYLDKNYENYEELVLLIENINME